MSGTFAMAPMSAPAAEAIDEAEWAAAVGAVGALPPEARILLMCHVNPDGDALGSMLAVGLGLRRLGYGRVQASFPEPYGVVEPFRFLPGQDLLVPPGEVDPAPELVLAFDAASPGRLGELVDVLGSAGTSIVLDHHATNSGFGGVRLIERGAAATAQVAAALLDRLGAEYDQAIATCLYAGLVTDTGSFKFDATTPEVHRLAARLLATGIPAAEISRRLLDSRPYAALQLLADVLGRAELDPAAAGGRGLVCAVATPEDLVRHAQPASVLESFIDVLRTAQEADVTCLVKPVSPGEWSVSLRSKGATDVAAVAVALGGGGHRLAAGFTGRGSASDVVAAIRARLGELYHEDRG